MERACRFYSSVFNQVFSSLPSLDPDMEMRMFNNVMSVYGAGGALVKHPMRPPSKDGTLVYFSCDDCSIEQNLVLLNGGIIFKPKFSIGANGFISIIGDTEGNAIGLHSFK